MNLELFIAKRIYRATDYKSSVSAPIIKIGIAAIAIGMVMMLISIATGQGLQKKIREKVAGFNGHVLITNFDNNESNTSLTPISKNQPFYPKFKKVNGIRHIQVFAAKPGVIRTSTDFEGIILKGVDKDYDWSFFREYMVAGSVPVFTNKTSKEVIVSKVIAQRLHLKVGDKFDTFFMQENQSSLPKRRVFEIKGIYDTGFEEFDKNLIIGDIKQVQRLNKWKKNQVAGFEVYLDNFDDLELKSEEIYKNIATNLDAKSLYARFPQIFEWIQLFDGNIAVIIIIMIVVAGINMITALLVLILEKTQFIGVLKTMGAQNWSIRKIFLYNATYIVRNGLIIGNIVGLLLIYVQYQFEIIKLDPVNYYVSVAPVSISLVQVLLLNLGTLGLCILMMLIPSYIITKITPAQSVKFS